MSAGGVQAVCAGGTRYCGAGACGVGCITMDSIILFVETIALVDKNKKKISVQAMFTTTCPRQVSNFDTISIALLMPFQRFMLRPWYMPAFIILGHATWSAHPHACTASIGVAGGMSTRITILLFAPQEPL
eukprot:SAG11_NODE_3469_length_2429_cov_3.871674_2_plen_131_part_00